MQHYASIEELLKAGAHFGHLTRRWNPKMEPFIFMEKNGIHILDLRKTQILLDIARDAIYDIAAKGRKVLFVGTKSQAKNILEEQAKDSNTNYVVERWLGGMLTNFSTIRKSIKRLEGIDKMSVDGTYDNITKKERLMLDRDKDKLRKVFGGIENMTRLPGAIFVVDIAKEHLAIKEAKILNIPVIGLVDTNSDPYQVDYPIPANDDSIGTIELISSIMATAIKEGGEVAKSKIADRKAESEQRGDSKGDPSKVKRKLRKRGGAAEGNKGEKRADKPVSKPKESVEAKKADAEPQAKAEVKAEAKPVTTTEEVAKDEKTEA